MATHLVFDIGGTNTRVALVEAGVLGTAEIIATPPSPDEGIQSVFEIAERLLGDTPLDGVCGCVAGGVVEGIVIGANNLVLWNGTPIVEKFSELFNGIPTRIFSDTELVGMGEYFYGAGKGFQKVLYVTVSTGVGKARIVGGRPEFNTDPFILAEELADMLVLEGAVSGTAVSKKYNKHPKDIDDAAILEGLAGELARGIVNSVVNFKPDVLIFGGSMIVGQNPIPLSIVEKVLGNLLSERNESSVVVKKAELGSVGGLYGGMAYVGHQQ